MQEKRKPNFEVSSLTCRESLSDLACPESISPMVKEQLSQPMDFSDEEIEIQIQYDGDTLEETTVDTLNNNFPKKRKMEETPEKPSIPAEYNEAPFILFYSAILKHRQNRMTQENSESSTDFLKNYFIKDSEEKSIVWPTNNKKIAIEMTDKNSRLVINLYEENADKKSLLLSITIVDKDLLIDRVNPSPNWTDTDIQDLITLFNFIYGGKIYYHAKTEKYKAKKILESDQKDEPSEANLNWFTLDEFKKACYSDVQKNSSVFLPYFINNHTLPEDGKDIFWITLDNKKLKTNEELWLKVSVSVTEIKDNPGPEDYAPYVFNGKSFLKIEYPQYELKNLSYFHTEVKECIYNKETETFKENPLLDSWGAPGFAKFGELHEMFKGDVLSGTEALNLFLEELNDLFKIQYIYTADSSREIADKDERHPDQVVLRVFMSIAEQQTFYEKFDFKPITCRNMEGGWYKEGNPQEIIHQNAEQYIEDRKEICAIKLTDLYKYFEKEESKSKKVDNNRCAILRDLCQDHYSSLNLYGNNTQSTNIPTFSDLTKTINNKFKENRKKEMEKMNPNKKSAKGRQSNASKQAKNDVKKVYQLQRVPDEHDKDPFLEDPKAETTTKGSKPVHERLCSLAYETFFKHTSKYAPENNSQAAKRQKFHK